MARARAQAIRGQPLVEGYRQAPASYGKCGARERAGNAGDADFANALDTERNDVRMVSSATVKSIALAG